MSTHYCDRPLTITPPPLPAQLWDTDNFIELRELRDSQKGRMVRAGLPPYTAHCTALTHSLCVQSEHAGDVRSLHIIRHGEDQVALTASMDSTMRLFRLVRAGCSLPLPIPVTAPHVSAH